MTISPFCFFYNSFLVLSLDHVFYVHCCSTFSCNYEMNFFSGTTLYQEISGSKLSIHTIFIIEGHAFTKAFSFSFASCGLHIVQISMNSLEIVKYGKTTNEFESMQFGILCQIYIISIIICNTQKYKDTFQ